MFKKRKTVTKVEEVMMRHNNMIVYLVGILVLLACTVSDSGHAQDVTLPEIDISGSPNGVVPLPENTPSVFTDVFSKYTKVVAPNGKPIHLIAQAGWADDQVVKARNVLEFILTDYPGSEYGSDKASVANAMADRKATMVLFNTPEELREAMRGDFGRVTDLSMQDLRANECPWEGSDDYMHHITRDASFEEIWHLVHDNGVTQVLPEMVAEMRAANDAAAKVGWRAWPEGEPEEHPNEYVGVLIDNYYDLWAVRPKKYEGRDIGPDDVPDGKTHFGRYFANSRSKMKELDPAGYKVIRKFFPPYLTYTPELPLDFEGTFSIELDESLAYTYKSQHLRNVILKGDNDANLTGNVHANELTGNSGNNILRGGGGDDRLNGNGGDDTAVFSGAYADYTVTKNEGFVTVSDERLNRDGTDSLTSIEFLQFSDRRIEL